MLTDAIVHIPGRGLGEKGMREKGGKWQKLENEKGFLFF